MNLHESSKERVYIKWNKNTHSILVNIDPYLLDDTPSVKFKRKIRETNSNDEICNDLSKNGDVFLFVKIENWKILEGKISRRPRWGKEVLKRGLREKFRNDFQRYPFFSPISSIKIRLEEELCIVEFCEYFNVSSGKKKKKCPKMRRFNRNHAEYRSKVSSMECWRELSDFWDVEIPDRPGGRGGRERRPGKKDDPTSSDEIKHDRTL